MSQKQDVRGFHTMQLVLWGALAMSQLLYLLVLVILTGEGRPDDVAPPDDLDILQLVFGAIALGQIPLIFFLRHLLFTTPARAGKFGDRTKARIALQTANLISWALAESVAIFGFVLAFLAYDVMLFVPFLVLALALMVALFPRTARQLEEVKT